MSFARCFVLLGAALGLAACDRETPNRPDRAASATPPPPPPSAAPEPAPDTQAICQRFAATPIPEGDLPSDGERASLRGCDAEALYYGIGTSVDFERARRCAFSTGSPEILLMIYANGQGVPPRLELALRFACQLESAPAELEARVGRLWQARSGGPQWPHPFDVCDDATSGSASSYCAAHEERALSAAREARKRQAALGLPASPFAALDSAARRFFDARSRHEVDLTGTARAQVSVEERAKLEEQLVATLEKLGDVGFEPQASGPQSLEKEMQQLLSRIASCKSLAELEQLVPGAVSRAGVRRTQSSWLAYRAAFVSLAAAARPKSPRGRWLALLDQQRVVQLRELADGC